MVYLLLMYAGFEILPANISQAVALAKLTGEALIEVWGKIVNTVSFHKITAKTIKNLLNPSTELDNKEVSLKVPAKIKEQIDKEAISRDLSVIEFIQMILAFFLESETPILQGDTGSPNLGVNSHLLELEANTEEYKSKQRIWQEDLIKLGQTELTTIGTT